MEGLLEEAKEDEAPETALVEGRDELPLLLVPIARRLTAGVGESDLVRFKEEEEEVLGLEFPFPFPGFVGLGLIDLKKEEPPLVGTTGLGAADLVLNDGNAEALNEDDVDNVDTVADADSVPP